MSVELGDLWQGVWHGFDTVIDVRAPLEFAEDHLPGAISLPVLSDEERARVGTIYKQVSPFDARKIGAALVARNAAQHIESQLMDKPGGWWPLVYCWRGGQRSNSFATILRQIGWRVEVLEGGYRSYRRAVVEKLYDSTLPFRLIRLDGNTGTAKTALLPMLQARGIQVVDLEGLAGHRGSILGSIAAGQPSQKGFESGLITAFQALDPAKPVVVEAESARIGTLRIPPALWQAMIRAPRVEIEAPVPTRAAYLARAYSDLLAKPAELTALLEGLRALVGAERVHEWVEMVESQDWLSLAEGLVVHHYDPAYARARRRDDAHTAAVVPAQLLTDSALPAVADQLAKALNEVDPG
ncbi:tRNA 2-selenouridine(34) synthase MnmH [Nioella aestuarii]|uniref:tRNA 2-selenouridine(34) synthase MnmH n=1 Tax=Nioella aestuarii TaxID=1662864 RepID=UPI003D7F2742